MSIHNCRGKSTRIVCMKTSAGQKSCVGSRKKLRCLHYAEFTLSLLPVLELLYEPWVNTGKGHRFAVHTSTEPAFTCPTLLFCFLKHNSINLGTLNSFIQCIVVIGSCTLVASPLPTRQLCQTPLSI